VTSTIPADALIGVAATRHAPGTLFAAGFDRLSR